MYIDPKKAHQERLLVARIERLNAIILDTSVNLSRSGSALKSRMGLEEELKELWKEMRADNAHEMSFIRSSLYWIACCTSIIVFLQIIDFFNSYYL